MTRCVIQVRVTPEQKAVIRERADAAGLRVSEWLRLLALGELAVVARVTSSDGSPAAGRVESLRVVADRAEVVLADEACPFTARQLQGRTGLPLSACERHLKDGSWRSLP